jgi:2-phospho-L-lactate guanylyltransferase
LSRPAQGACKHPGAAGQDGRVDGWTLLVPVKELAVAKTRLSRFAGAARADLALAFAIDTVTAALATDPVRAVLVVTDDARVVAEVTAAGADVVGDEPRAGLNPALQHGADVARSRHGPGPVAALSADLPALRPADLSSALGAAADLALCFVADVDGTGTTLLAARDDADLRPAFGHRSRARHRATGAVELTGALVSLRRDVDTEVDLYDAQRLGVGPRTREILDALGQGRRES